MTTETSVSYSHKATLLTTPHLLLWTANRLY